MKRLAELSQKVHKKVEQKNIPVREFQQKYTALLRVDPESIERKIKQFNAMDDGEDEVIDIFEMLLEYGIQRSASDIHINAYESFYWLRYRIDGKIVARYLLNHELAGRFALIIKERCNIDMINVYAPQGGSFSREYENRTIDFRIEIAPSQYGENIVLRILDKSTNIKSLNSRNKLDEKTAYFPVYFPVFLTHKYIKNIFPGNIIYKRLFFL